jgi:hypothetical protein
MSAIDKYTVKRYIKEDTTTPYICAYLLSRILDEVTDVRLDDQYLQSLFGWSFSDEELKECDALVQAIRAGTPDWLFKDQPDLRRSVGNIELFDYIYPEFVGTYGD